MLRCTEHDGDPHLHSICTCNRCQFWSGFDLLGLALEGAGDRVTVSLAKDKRIQVRSIVGDNGLLPLNPQANTASIAARAVLEEIGVQSGLIIDIEKGLPIGSGSAALLRVPWLQRLRPIHFWFTTEDEAID